MIFNKDKFRKKMKKSAEEENRKFRHKKTEMFNNNDGDNHYFILYHSADNDGKLSNMIVQRALANCGSTFTSLGYNYQDMDFSFLEDKKVICVDLSCLGSKEQTLDIVRKTDFFIWIDHHKTSLEINKNIECSYHSKDGYSCSNRFILYHSLEKSACELAWEFFFWFDKIPKFIELCGKYDSWNHHNIPNVMDFITYSRKLDLEKHKKDIFDDNKEFVDLCFQKGKTIREFEKKRLENTLSQKSFVGKLLGFKTLFLNTQDRSSYVFGTEFEKSQPECDVFAAFDVSLDEDTKKFVWKFSLYSKTVDVSKIAEKFGGGGHASASGFRCWEFPGEMK